MIRTIDTNLAGIAKVYEDVTEMTRLAVAHAKLYNNTPYNGEWVGRDDLTTWDKVDQATREPWQDGLFEVTNMVEEINQAVPAPRSIKRQRFWNEVQGDVEVNRVLTGNPMFMSETRRSPRSHVPQNVTVIFNVGNIGSWSATEIFWRGAAGIAAIDMLEKAGFNCEVWIYNLASDVFRYPTPNSLACCKVKSSGEPLDIDTMVTATSAWFFRTVIFELRKDDPDYSDGHTGKWVKGSSHDRVTGWDKYLEVENGVTPVFIPAVRTREAAVAAAKGMIARVTGQQTPSTSSTY